MLASDYYIHVYFISFSFHDNHKLVRLLHNCVRHLYVQNAFYYCYLKVLQLVIKF